MTDTSNERLLTPEEAADFLRISKNTLRRLTLAGGTAERIPSVKFGPRLRRYRQTELAAWLSDAHEGANV